MTGARPFAALLLSATLAACASSGDYPSLAQRPAERAQGSFAADPVEVAPAPPPAPSADLVARLAALRRDAAGHHAQFMAGLPSARRLAAAAGPSGSDSWASAEVALADLDSLRSQTAVALADLDALWVDATIEPGPREAVGTVRDEVESLVRAEDEALRGLRARVG